MRGRRTAGLGVALVLAGLTAPLAWAADPSEPDHPITRTAERLGLAWSKGAPMTIGAEELEMMRDEGGQERVVFRNNVAVVQGDLRVRCDWLEASYPDGAGGRPKRIVARGGVRIAQAESEVLCTEAVFNDETCTAVCTSSQGPAELRRGGNVVRGDEIVFDLCSGHLKVRGGARVDVKPREPRP